MAFGKNYYYVSKDNAFDSLHSYYDRRNIKLLTPVESESINHKFYVAFDVENNPKTSEFICAGFYGKFVVDRKLVEFSRYCATFEEFKQTFEELAPYNITYIAYNLRYDISFCVKFINTERVIANAGKIIQAQLYDSLGAKKIWDIQNVSGIEYSLENWIEILRMKERFGVVKEKLIYLEARVKNDAKATYILAEFISEFFRDKMKINLKFTISACAMEIYKKQYLKYAIARYYLTTYEYDQNYLNDLTYQGLKLAEFEKNYVIKQPESIDLLERGAYHGGRTEITLRGYYYVRSYDFNSMYLSTLKEDYPNPMSAVYISENNLKYLRKGWKFYFDRYLGIYDVTVYIPNNFNGKRVILGPLPYKNNDNKNIEYPTGFIRGVYTNIELQNALQYGLSILQVHSFVYYRKKEKYFNDFMVDVWQQRVNYKSEGNTPMEIMIKKIGNSLVGRFGMKYSEVNYFGKEVDLTDDLRNIIYESGNNFTSKYYDNELWIIYNSRQLLDSKISFVCWASFTTAYARVKLYNMAKQVEDYIIYMDTDSIKTTTDCPIILDNSKELGRMKLEYTIEADGKIIGEPFYSCKHYGNIFTNPKLKGVKTSKMKYSNICPKGMLILDERDLINMRFNIIKIDESTGIMVFTFNKPYLWREAVRRGKKMALWESITKTLLVQDTKRVWYGEEFYGQGKKSYPIHYKGGDKLLENLAVQNVITVAKTNLKVSA